MNADLFIETFAFSGSRGFATDDDIATIYAELLRKEDSARLWNFCGDAIQLYDGDRYTFNDARVCYERAVEIAPDDPVAYESLGFWHDVQDNLEKSAEYFNGAIQRSNSDTPRLGLARVFSQLGRKRDALLVLELCTEQNSEEWIELQREIEDGTWSPDG